MQTLLRINSSARSVGSHSRALGDHFETLWRRSNPTGLVITRDLAANPVEQIQEPTIAGFYSPAEQLTPELRQATALSDNLIGEIQEADVLLVTVPIYNFGIPAALKAWIDQIVRIGHTFSYDGTTFNGLVKADRAYIICAYGAAGYLDEGPLTTAHFVRPYLTFLLQFLGIGHVHFVGVEATSADAATVRDGVERACMHA